MFFSFLLPLLRSASRTDMTPHTAEGSYLTWNWAEYFAVPEDFSNFDIKYKGKQTTFNDGGWCTEFRVDGKPSGWQRIHGFDNGKATYRDTKGTVRWETHIERPLGHNYLLIKFQCYNDGKEPRKISLSCYADIKIANNDKATVSWYGRGDRRGLTMYDRQTDITLTLVAKNGYGVTNYDSFWFGEWEGSDKRHQLDNRPSDYDLIGVDSVFSLGWKDRVIYGGKDYNFTVLVGVGEDLPDPPLITVDENLKETYKGGDEVIVTGIVKDYSVNEKVWVNWSIDTNPVQSDQIPFEGDLYNGLPFSFKFRLPQEVGQYNLTIQASDKTFLNSNLYQRAMLVNEAPRLEVNRESMRSEYLEGSIVEVTGTFWDDGSAKLGYRFDDDFMFTTDEWVVCNGATKTFRRQFPLRELSKGLHRLYVWAEDNYGVKTPMQMFPFRYRNRHAPTIEIYNPTGNTHRILDYFEIKGKASDVDLNEQITIWYKDPLSDPAEPFQQASIPNGFLPADANGIEFSVIFQIPRNYPIDTNLSFIFRAQDNNQGFSKDATYQFNVTAIPAPTPFASPTPFPYPTNHLKEGETAPGEVTWTASHPTYFETKADVSQGEEEYNTWSTKYEQITLHAPNPPPTPLPSETPVPPEQTAVPFKPPEFADERKAGKQEEGKNTLIPIIAGSAAAVAVAAIIAGVVIWHEAAKKAKEFNFNAEDAEYAGEMTNAAVENENALYNADANDDPFANEFDEEAPQDEMFPQ